MKTHIFCLALILAAAPAALAEEPPRPPQKEDPAAGLDRSLILLARARDQQAEEGCKAAIPTYRVVASFGGGYEAAQYELGACLLSTPGDTPAEAGLMRDEALVWLKHAAYAGDARAQGRLAEILSGTTYVAVAGLAASPVEAMGWSLVYDANPTRDIFGLAKTPPLVAEHLQSVLTPADEKSAQDFAKEFKKFEMAEFVPPPRPAQKRALRKQGAADPREGGRQRRR